MKKIFNFKIQHLLATLLLIAGTAVTFSACSDDDDNSNAPAVKKTSSTFNTIGFEWSAVSGATEYKYRLVQSADGEDHANNGKEVASGTTTDTKINFTGLTATKTYDLYVSAIVGGAPTAEGHAAAATGFQLAQPSASMKVRMTEGKDGAIRMRKTTLSWSATSAEKYGYSIDGGTEVITTETSVKLPDNFSIGTHKLAIRSISSDPLFNNSTAKEYTFNPSGSVYNGNFGSKALGITADAVTIEAWRIVDDVKFEDILQYRMDFTEAGILKQVFTCYPSFGKDDKTYTLKPLGVGISEVKEGDKVIGYDFGTIDGKPILVTSMTIDNGFGTLSVTFAYSADRKLTETVKVPLTAKKKATNEL